MAVRHFKEDIRRDLGGDLTRAQETILELAAQRWVVVQSLYQWIASQPTLITRKRKVLDVVLQAAQLEEGLARMLDRLGLERRAKPFDLAAELARLHHQPAVTDTPPPEAARAPAQERARIPGPGGDMPEAQPTPASAADAPLVSRAGEPTSGE